MNTLNERAPAACGCDDHAGKLTPLHVAIERGLELATAVADVDLLSAEFSGRAALLSMADGVVVIAADSQGVEKGEMLEFISL